MKERLIKNSVTSLIGLVIIGFSGYVILKDMDNGQTAQQAATGMAGWITLGLMFLRSKDSIIGIEKKDDAANGEQ